MSQYEHEFPIVHVVVCVCFTGLLETNPNPYLQPKVQLTASLLFVGLRLGFPWENQEAQHAITKSQMRTDPEGIDRTIDSPDSVGKHLNSCTN